MSSSYSSSVHDDGPVPAASTRAGRHPKATFDAMLRQRNRSEKSRWDDTSGSVHILAIDVSDTATPSLSANHSKLPLRREIPEHGSD